MPSHLWEAAKRDVRGVIPDWLRSARENGADAPPHIREVARRAARAGAGLGVAIAVGSGADVAAGSTAVVPVASSAPLPPGSDQAVTGPALAETFRVADLQAGHEGWLQVEMYQDVVVNEGTQAGHSVDAFQYLVVSDRDGRSYVFKEHHHAALAEPPARETDLLIHERGQVHVTENPDGSFSVDTVGYDRSVRGPDDEPVDLPDDVPADPFDETPDAGLDATPDAVRGPDADPAAGPLDDAAPEHPSDGGDGGSPGPTGLHAVPDLPDLPDPVDLPDVVDTVDDAALLT